MAKVSVLGAGSWGTALAVMLHGNHHQVTLWSALSDEVAQLRRDREQKGKLPGVHIPEDINITDCLEEAVKDREMLVLAVPSVFVRGTARQLSGLVPEGQLIVCVAKGVEEDTLMTMTDIIEQELPMVDAAVLSGPSHAEEAGKGIPTTCVAGAHTRQTAEHIQNRFMSETFRVYTSPDMLGIELGAALKNGLGYGDNTKAALITRGMAEISRLGIAMGGKIETFYGLSGIGDLIVTCASVHSRNRRAGYLIGQGCTMQEAMDQVKMVVEGVYSAKAARELAEKYQVEMPIIEQVNRVLFENKAPGEAVRELMLRDKKIETSVLAWE